MVRTAKKTAGPSRAARFAVSAGGNDDGKMLMLSDVCSPDELHTWLGEVLASQASVTIHLTRDTKTLAISYFVDGENYPWYIQDQDGWTAMLLRTSVDQD